MSNLVQLLKNDLTKISRIELSDDDFVDIAKEIGYTKEEDFFVDLLIRRIKNGYDDFSSFSKENQIKALSGLASQIHEQYELLLMEALRLTMINRLGFGEHDHRFSCLSDLIETIGLVTEPESVVNKMIDNLSKVFNLLKVITVEEGIRRFHRQNVQAQFNYLLKAASLL